MRVLKVSLLSFLTLILLTLCSFSQAVLPDSLLKLTASNKPNDVAKGWQKATAFYFQQHDSVKYAEALRHFNQLNLEKLKESQKRDMVTAHSQFLRNSLQYQIAKQFLLHAIENAREQNDFESKAIFHQLLAPHYFYTFEYDSSNYHLDKAIAIYSKLNITAEIGELTILKSGISYAQGDYEIAIKLAYEAVEFFKKTDNNEEIAVAYLQLGNILFFLDDYQQSMKYYKLSLSSFEVNENDEGIYRALSNVGLVNLMLKNYRKSISQQLIALHYFVSNNHELEKGNAYLFLSDAYWELESYDSSKYYNQLSIASNSLSKYAVGVAEGYLMQSRILSKEKNVQGALISAKRSFSISDSVQQFEGIKNASEQLAIIYESLSQIDSSYRYLKIKSSLRDSLDVDPNLLKGYAIKHQLQIDEAQFELLLAKEKTRIQEQLNAKKQTQLLVAIIVASCSILSLALAIILLYRNKILSKSLTEKQNQITAELEIKESLLNEIHHRVKNNLQVISSMLSLQTRYISDHRVQKVISDCKSRINSMSLIHESLYKKTDGVEAPFSEYVKTLVKQLIDTYKIDQAKIKANVDLKEIYLSLDESIPCGLLINEIVSNSLKHAFPEGKNGQINISLSRKEGFIRLQIADNGIGFNDEPDLTKDESFGFLLIDTLVKQLEAEMECVNENGVTYSIKWRSIS